MSVFKRESSPVRPPRILLVDDEPPVIRGLRRVLSSAEPTWQILTAFNGQEALEIMRGKRSDVVVTDLSMPTMNGLSLLLQLSKRFPETIRIVHSSHLETLGTELVRYLAHNVLKKPASAIELIGMVKWAMNLRDSRAPKSLGRSQCA